jgi:hypothetical protein
MAAAALALLIALEFAAAAVPATLQPPRDGDCKEWRACRQLALEAAERGEYETFHDLAWRAVQTGPARDPSLMYLVARAQALSGRPHDALIMLRRLTEMGVAPDATTDDFGRTRQLAEWPEVEARIAAVAASASAAASPSAAAPPARPASPAPAARPSSPAPASASPLSAPVPAPRLAVVPLPPATQAVRFSARQFAVGGIAYDAISDRFVLGDRLGRKLVVVDERSNQTVDLVRADSAEFLDISAVEIDAKLGDLWVASAAAADGAGTLHRLQLISGRPLRAFHVADDLRPVKLVDLAVSPGGAVLVLDSVTPQLLVLRSGGTALERVVRIGATELVSVAAAGDDGIAFVAHRDGLSLIDLRSRTVSLVTVPKGVTLGHLERIRWHGKGLIAVQVDDDGSRRVIRLEMNARGSGITQATRLEVSTSTAGQTFVTISGDELVYLTGGSAEIAGRVASDASVERGEFAAYRVPLR